MNIFERAKKIIISPQTEWDVISNEPPNTSAIITGYVLPLAGLAAIAAFIGYGFVGVNYGFFRIKGIEWGLYQGLTVLIGAILGVFISAFVIDMLAPSFGSEKNMGRSVQLVAYSYTPAWIGGLLAILPAIALVGALAGLYGLYLIYAGMPKIKKTPADKHVGYFVVSLLVMIVVVILIGWILRRIFLSAFGLTMPGLDIDI
jgi:hypothetical protein